MMEKYGASRGSVMNKTAESVITEKSRRRCIILGLYTVEHSSTVRECAAHFGLGKSTVHKDLRERLRYADPRLYSEVTKVLEHNKSERHIRGGAATKNKYLKIRLEVRRNNEK